MGLIKCLVKLSYWLGIDRYEKDEEFIYIPILESIEQLLSNKRLAEIIFTSKRRQENCIYYDVYDGTILNEDQYYQEKQNNSL